MFSLLTKTRCGIKEFYDTCRLFTKILHSPFDSLISLTSATVISDEYLMVFFYLASYDKPINKETFHRITVEVSKKIYNAGIGMKN